MITQEHKQKINYTEGEQTLKKAVTSEKDSRRYYGMYIQWVHKYQVPLEVISDQLVKIKGWSVLTAKKYAKSIMLLADPDSRQHLQSLLNGEISFEVASMRVSQPSPRPPVYNDEETATRYLQRAFMIMRHRNKTWKDNDILIWAKDVLAKFS